MDSSYKSSGHPNSLNSTQVLLDKYMLAGPVSHAAGTCQHCLWPGEQRRDSFQGVLFPYPFIIYLPGHKSVFPCSCKAPVYGSSVFRKVYSFALPVLIYSVNHFKKFKKPIYFTIKSPLLNSQVLHRSSAWSVVPVGILYFTGTWSHTATQLCPWAPPVPC